MKTLNLILAIQILLFQLAVKAQDTSAKSQKIAAMGKAQVILSENLGSVIIPDLAVPEVACKISEQKLDNIAAKSKNGKIKSLISNITVSDNKIFYKVSLKNHSNISFDIDFIKFFIRDVKTAKRTVTQEQEIHPLSSFDTKKYSVNGKNEGSYAFAFNKFPISKGKALFVEIHEKNGARHQNLKVNPKDIEDAKAL